MSASKSIDAVQVQITTPTLSDINPINTEPLLQTIAHGDVPSNYQINDAIDRTVDAIEETKEKAHLNDKGERLVKDAEALLHTAQRLVNERNPGDSLQHLLADSKEAAHDATKELSKQGAHLVKDIKNALPHIPTSKTDLLLTTLPTIATNLPDALSHLPHFSMGDFKNLLEQLTSTAEFNFPTGDLKVLGGDAKDAYNLGKEILLYAVRSKEFRGLMTEIGDFFHGVFGDASGKFSELSDAMKKDFDNKDFSASKTAKTLTKDGKEIVEAAKDAHPIEMTDELRKEYYAKFSKLVHRIAEKPEYKKLLDLYWKYMDEIKEKAEKMSDKLKEKAEELADEAMEKGAELKDKVVEKVEDKAKDLEQRAKSTAVGLKDEAMESVERVRDESAPAFDKVWNDVTDLIDSFGGRGFFNDFYSKMYRFYARLYHDKAARSYLHDLRQFTSDAVHNPKSLATEDTTKKGMQLFTRGRELIHSQRYVSLYNQFFYRWNTLLDKFSNDTLVNEFSQELQKFFADFALDSKGRPDIYAITESLDQFKSFIYPILVKQLENMVIAKIDGASESYDWSIEHLAVGIANFVPEYFDLRTKNHLKMNVKDMEANQNNTRIVLDIHSLKPHFNDVKFWYRRRSFPHIEDSGVVDVDLTGGQGTRIKVIWKIKSKHNRPYAFSLMEVKCIIDKMDIQVKDAKHDILDRMAASLFVTSIKQQVANAIVNSIVDVLKPLNDSINKWFATRPIGHVFDKINEELRHSVEKKADEVNYFIQHHPVDHMIDIAKEGASEAYEMITDRASDAMDTASALKRKAEKTLSEESGRPSDYKERAIEMKDAAIHKASDLKNAALDKAEHLKDQVQAMDISSYIPTDMADAKDKAEHLKEKITEKGTELKDSLTERYPQTAKLAETIKDKAVEKGMEIKDQVMEQAPELAKKANEYKDKALEKGMEIKDKVMEEAPELAKKATDLKDKAVEKGMEIKDKVMEEAPELAKKATDLKDKAVEKGMEIKDQVMEQAPELADKATKKATELKDAAVDKASDLADKAKEKYPDAVKKASDLKDQAVEKVSELSGKAKDEAIELSKYAPSSLPDAVDKATELKDKAVEKGSELKDKAVEKASELKDKAMEKGAEVKDQVMEEAPELAKKASDLKDKAVEKGSELKDKAMEKGSELKNKAVEKGSEAMEKGSELKDKAVEKGSELKEKASEKASELKEQVEKPAAELRDNVVETGKSFADAAKGSSQKKEKKNKKEGSEDKWHSTWKKPSKTAKPQQVERVTITQEIRETVVEKKIEANPFEALSEENLATLKKNAS